MILPPNSIIVSGPIIIEDGKILLNKERKTYGSSLWMVPGGTVEDFNLSLEETCRRETKEEMGIDLTDLKLFKVTVVKRPEAEDRLAILVHFLAKRVGEIQPGPETIDWGWFDINNLPPDCAPNIDEIIQDLK